MLVKQLIDGPVIVIDKETLAACLSNWVYGLTALMCR